MSENVKIKADIMWANLVKPNDMSEKYQVNLANLSDKAVSALEAMGLNVMQKEGQGFYITAKSNNPIKAFDTDGVEIDGSIVGNNSKAIAVVSYYDWKYKNKEGRSPSLRRLVITDLEVYGEDTEGLVEAITDDDEVL